MANYAKGGVIEPVAHNDERGPELSASLRDLFGKNITREFAAADRSDAYWPERSVSRAYARTAVELTIEEIMRPMIAPLKATGPVFDACRKVVRG